MKNISKLILNGLISCLWRALPLCILASGAWFLIDAYDEIGYYAALLVFGGTICFVVAVMMFFYFGFEEKDYEELSGKRRNDFKKSLTVIES